METPTREQKLDPTALPPGTRIGAWRVDRMRDRGTFGTVYRAVHAEKEHAAPVALKLAVYPKDARFEREVELLSRIRHPSVPPLLDSGIWRSPLGDAHPFIVMEWVEGIPLYEWAAWNNPSSRRVLALLAQAARALQATHEVRAVHRDVKGENILVRPSDGRLFLTDLGAGYFAGAPRRTPRDALPGTPDYRSPELWEHEQREDSSATAAWLARPSDDVFALGVTAYKLVTGTYPPFTHPAADRERCWHPDSKGPPPPRQLNPRVDAQLNALILRMLSARPEERGSALELAEAMERGVAHAPPSADTPLYPYRAYVPFMAQQARQVKPRKWLPWLAAAMALGLWPANTDSVRTVEQPTVAQGAPGKSTRKEDSVSLGDTALGTSETAEKPSSEKPIAMEVPKNPLPGQLKPNSKGRCPAEQVPINGGCWGKVALGIEHCHGPSLFVHEGRCYVPAYEGTRRPTSAPQQR